MSLEKALDWNTDLVRVEKHDLNAIGNDEQKQLTVSFSDFRDRLHNVPAGPKEIIVDTVLDLTTLAAFFKKICTIPAGSFLKYVGLYVTTTVAGGADTAKLGIGLHGSAPAAYALATTLTKGTHAETCPGVALAASTNVDLSGLLTDGSTITDTNITAGVVHCVVIYDQPNALVG